MYYALQLQQLLDTAQQLEPNWEEITGCSKLHIRFKTVFEVTLYVLLVSKVNITSLAIVKLLVYSVISHLSFTVHEIGVTC